jgi:nitrogenase molybdenum-cofactor synthesis protein NifE
VPVVVGSDASFSPFELAFNLIEYGFDVRVVLALHMKGADEDAEARLLAAYPHVRTVREKSVDALEIDAEAANWLAIGADAAFLMGATRVVDMYHDEGYFGYQGIERLMNEVTAAMGEGADAAAKYAADANAVSADERAAVAFTATATKGAGE